MLDARLLIWALLALLPAGPSCGYHVRSSVGKLPYGMQSIGIPGFRNLTGQFAVEQIMTEAVLKEFSARTAARVTPESGGVDAVLLGDILSVNSVPVTFGSQETGSQTFGSAFLVTVRMSVLLKRTSDSAVLWRNEDFLYSERYVLNRNVRDFFSEENPALQRLARSFAASLAGAILERPKP
jgi:hypothetical protein